MRDLELSKKTDYLAIGVDEGGRRNMEGLLPDRILSAVYGEEHALVQKATQGTNDEARSAKARLKNKLLERFRNEAQPNGSDFEHFYKLVKQINKLMDADFK